MYNKSANKAYASIGIKSSKWLLLLCTAVSAAVDILIIVQLFLGGVGAEYFVCPFMLLAFDVIYFVISLFFTNFRFKYSLFTWISYIVSFTIGMAVGSAILFAGNGTVLTNGAIGLWAGVHSFSIICVVITALFASRTMKNKWVALALTAVYLAGGAFYAGYMFTEGFFGQGFGRTLVYKLNEGGESYCVYDALSGRATKAEIPETFNGKPVTAVSLNLFMNPSVTEIHMHGDLEFAAEEALSQSMDLSGKVISVDKAAANAVRSKLYDFTGSGDAKSNAVALANAVRPAALDEGEGYVTFTYDVTFFYACGGKVIPVYIGNLSEFDFDAYAAEFGYAAHRNDGSVENLDWAYKNGGYVFTDAKAGEVSVIDGKPSESVVAEIEYEKVYRLEVESGNDTKYDLHEKQPEVCFDELGGETLNFKYVTEKTADGVLESVNKRKGFTLNWRYDGNGAHDAKVYDSLSDFIAGNNLTDVTATPVWTLNAPTINLTTSAAGNSITYGEDVTVYSGAAIEAEGVTLVYDWTFNDGWSTVCNTKDVALTLPKPAEASGKYSLTVSVDGGETTSLKSFAEGEINLIINKKRVALDWSVPTDLVYDGTEKTVSVSFDRAQLVGDDDFRFTLVGGTDNTYKVENARAYNLTVSVTEGENNYEVIGKSRIVTVTPRPAPVTWSGYENLIYNGSYQSPTATAVGVDGDISVYVQGSAKNAGENYTAMAVTADSNYTLTNARQKFKIAKKALTVTPRAVRTEYGTDPVSTGIYYEGFVDGDDVSVLGGATRYAFTPSVKDIDYRAGTYPNGVSISGLTALNYEITYGTAELEIERRRVEVVWNENTEGLLLYNAQPKNITAAVGNAVGDDDVRITVEGGDAINAGSYRAEATGIVGADADNYEFTPEEHLYIIHSVSLRIVAHGGTSNYGEDYKDKIYAEELDTNYNNEVEYTVNGPTSDNAGVYDVTITVKDGEKNNNYIITTVNGTHEIKVLHAYPKWLTESQRKFYYDGTPHGILGGTDETTKKYFLSGILEKDLPKVTIENYSAVEVGLYTARVVLDDEIKNNYILDNATCKWEIKAPDLQTSVYINKEHIYTTINDSAELSVTAGNIINFSFTFGHESTVSPEVEIVVKKDGANLGTAEPTTGYTFEGAGVYEFVITSSNKYLLGKQTIVKVTVSEAQ